MIGFEIKNIFTNEVQFTAKIDCEENASQSLKLGLAVKWAVENNKKLSGADLEDANLEGANLRGANLEGADLQNAYLKSADLKSADLSGANLEGVYLTGADLTGANLKGSNFRDANLEGANLRGANLEGVYLTGADLTGADLTGANLKGSNFRDANLEGANLRGANLEGSGLEDANLEAIKQDMFDVLENAKPEIPALKQAIIAGKIDGSTYEGECACLCGTIEKSARFKALNIDIRDSDRPIERFFLMIRDGDTPETNQASKIALGWIEEFEAKKGE